MEENNAYHAGHNYYWHGNQPNPYREGSIEYADWWAGWEDAVEEDKEPVDCTAKAKGIKVFLGLIRGYYQATRKEHGRLFSLCNGIRLAVRAYT